MTSTITIAAPTRTLQPSSRPKPTSTPAEVVNFGNDYSSAYVSTGVLPQNRIANVEDPLAGYPKLQQLHELKREHNRAHASHTSSLRVEPHQISSELSQLASQGAQFDVVMLHGCAGPFPSLECLIKLPIATLTPRPSLIFFWVPTSKLADGRQALEQWGFRRAEDIVYIVSSETSPHMPPAEPDQVFKSTSWHCLMGLKGTLRRSEDSRLINCNVDTDVIIEKANARANIVPEEIYNLIENFTSMARRIHVVLDYAPETLPVRLRPGWLVVSPDVLTTSMDIKNFKSRKSVPVDPEIDQLRPRTPKGHKFR